ncbi:MAG: DNA adenine methylase [Methylococcaceae bacterium]|nr:DNA adenine methylase [Methylococcaceae bacterium]
MSDKKNRYLGSKNQAGTYQRIISLMPPHSLYIESHLGTGVVMKKKPACKYSFGVDPNEEILSAFKCDKGEVLVNSSFIDFISQLNLDDYDDVLIYSDPPYLLETRKSTARYKYEYSEQDHIDLLRTLKGLSSRKVKNIISCYPSKLYDEELHNWNSIKYQTMTHGGPVTEQLYFDFEPDGLHWIKYAGKNRTDRQRIKRKVASWKGKYEGLPDEERVAILAGLLEVDFNIFRNGSNK